MWGILLLCFSGLALCSKQSSWPTHSFKTEKFAAPLVSIKTFDEVAPGHFFLGPKGIGNRDATAPMIVGQDGHLIWRTYHNRYVYATDTQELHGKPVLTYWSGDHATEGYGCGFGHVSILDDTYTELHRVCGSKLDINPIPYNKPKPPCLLDSHESRLTSRGTILVTARSLTPADLTSVGGHKDGWVLDSLFYELDPATEKVLLRWSTYEHRHQLSAFKATHYPLKRALGSGYWGSKEEPWDFAHMNSVQLVPDPLGGYMVSLRYLWAAIKLDKDGNVEWVLNGGDGADFNSPHSANFSYQHAVLVSDVTEKSLQMTMFDNANNEHTDPQRPSSGLKLHLNLESKTVTTLQRYSPNKEISSVHTGNYQALPFRNHVLVDFGDPPVVNEFDANGKVLQELRCGQLGADTYRAYKKEWKGFPKTKPKVFAQDSSADEEGTEVWASWNGATEVHRWEFHGRRQGHDHFEFAQTVQKHGFETRARLLGKYSQFFARAIHANNSMIGQSEMRRVQAAPIQQDLLDKGNHSGSTALAHPGRWTFLALAMSLAFFALS